MRTLKFTHEQIEVLKSALIIAETEMAKQAETMYKIGMKDVQKMFMEKHDQFYNFRADINDGTFDD